jgi:pyruvate dehydrogenase E2 component (dihydrolipoamide acetyltransferase)
VKEGDSCSPGDAIAEIETDKASMAFECTDDIVIAKLLVPEGSEVAVGSPILVTVEEDTDVSVFSDFVAPISTSIKSAPAETPSTETATSIPSSSDKSGGDIHMDFSNVRVSPAAARMIESKKIAFDAIQGTSRGGLISKSDVVLAIKNGITSEHSFSGISTEKEGAKSSFVQSNTSASKSTSIDFSIEDPTMGQPINDRFEDIPNSNMRKVIARRLTESKATVPHLLSQIECELDDLLSLRKTFAKDLSTNVSVNDMVIKAAALALRDLPDMRRQWKGDAIGEPGPVDISVAVATPNGLITPIVTGADRRGCSDINATVKDLATRARENKLMPEEYQGGSFSISNLGMFGITSFSAVINPPQAAILAVGAGVPRVKPPLAGSDEPRVATVLNVQLSSDRRVVDEALASQFLKIFASYISNPKTILL